MPLSAPSITEAPAPAGTRFSTAAEALGSTKVTLAAEPMLKLCQSITARSVFRVMVRASATLVSISAPPWVAMPLAGRTWEVFWVTVPSAMVSAVTVWSIMLLIE